MDFTLKISFLFFLLSAANGQFVSGSSENPKEKSRHFHMDISNETRELLNLSQTLSHKFTTIEFKTKESLADLSGMLSGELKKWDSKLETSLRNLSQSLGGSLPSSELKETRELPSTTFPLTTLSTNENPTERMSNAQLPMQTEVERLNGNNGTIEFRGENNMDIGRKIWVLWDEGKTFRWNQRFVMEENNLGENAHLSLWAPFADSHVWNGSQTDWKKERTSNRDLVLLTLAVKPSANPPSFKLKFTSTSHTSPYGHSGEIVRKDGVESVSFPHHNAQNYSPWSDFHAVIAPKSGRPFSLTLKYLDAPGTPPECDDNFLGVYLFEENATETNFKRVDRSAFSECGRLGNVSQFLGTSTVAILRFYSHSYNTGTGFRIEITPTD